MPQRSPQLAAPLGRLRAGRPATRFTAAAAVAALVLGVQALTGAPAVPASVPAGGPQVAPPAGLLEAGTLPDPGAAIGGEADARAALGSAVREGAGEGTTGEARPHTVPAAPLDTGEIATQMPRVKLQGEESWSGDPVRRALEVDGVTFATAIELGEIEVDAPAGPSTVQLAAVETEGFRVMTPQISADHTELWERISEGDAAFTHDVAARLELELPSRVRVDFEGARRRASVRVGAFASNGVPPVADLVTTTRAARALGFHGTRTLLVAIAEDADVERVAADLATATGLDAEVIDRPQARRAFLTGDAARQAFEPFTYVSLGDGMIQIDQAWTARNIATADVPIFRGPVTCHRLLLPQLRGALQEIVDRDLEHLIDTSQYGGCWVPRHILFNPRRGLSMHAWGLAIDINVRGNEYGNRNPEMDPRVVEIFERWGFVWGGHWSTPDGMHFELGALLDDSAA